MEHLVVLSYEMGRGKLNFAQSYSEKEILNHTLQYLQDVFKEPIQVYDYEHDDLVFMNVNVDKGFGIRSISNRFRASLGLSQEENAIYFNLPHVDPSLETKIISYTLSNPLHLKIPNKPWAAQAAQDYFVNTFEGGVFALKRCYSEKNWVRKS